MTNQNIRRAFLLAIVVVLIVPFTSVQAIIPPLKGVNWQKLNPILPGPKAKNTEEFCAKFTDVADKISSRLDEQKTKVTGYLSEHKNTLEEDRAARDATLKEQRAAAEKRRQEWYARLTEKADTDAKKDAVLQFKQAVETAVETRQAAVDAAILAFRKGVDDAAASRKGSMQGVRDTFKASVDAAVAQVKTDCDNGETTATIRSNFKNSLKAAREALQADKKDIDKVGKQVTALAAVRQKAVDTAIAQFQDALKTATDNLKKAFGE